MLKEANRFKRQELLQHANADQVNAVSELVLNLLKNNISVTPPIMEQLRPYKKVLRYLGRRQHSVKKLCQWLVSKKAEDVARTQQRVMSMSSTTTQTPLNLDTCVILLQDANRERDEWKENSHYWKHKYHMLYREYMHILSSLLCERCRNLEDGELCAECSNTPWKRCT